MDRVESSSLIMLIMICWAGLRNQKYAESNRVDQPIEILSGMPTSRARNEVGKLLANGNGESESNGESLVR